MEDKSSIKTQLNFSVDSILKKTQHKRKSDETLHSLKSPKETKINTKECSKLPAIVEVTDCDAEVDLEDEVEEPRQPVSAGYLTSRNSGVTVELLGQDLWKKFYRLGTEMIITKAGRRMFPTLKVRVSGLKPKEFYALCLQITPFDDKRYRYVYHSSKWMVAGAGDPLPSSSLFLHGDSPCLGEMWTAQSSVVFDKLKVTNNRCTIIQGQICLHSMHKYLPKVLVIRLSGEQVHMTSEALLRHFEEFGLPPGDAVEEFVFPETAFITVTAYQNQQITKLKIDSNPFAKGFREATRTREPTNAHGGVADFAASPYFQHLSMEALIHRHNPFVLNPFLSPYVSPLWMPPPLISEQPTPEETSP